MERYAWKATVLPGKLEEYIRRHNEIWPEMKDVLHQAGIRNYPRLPACRPKARSWTAGTST